MGNTNSKGYNQKMCDKQELPFSPKSSLDALDRANLKSSQQAQSTTQSYDQELYKLENFKLKNELKKLKSKVEKVLNKNDELEGENFYLRMELKKAEMSKNFAWQVKNFRLDSDMKNNSTAENRSKNRKRKLDDIDDAMDDTGPGCGPNQPKKLPKLFKNFTPGL